MMEFGTAENMEWRAEAVHFPIHLDGKKIRCRISAEAIDDHFGNPVNNGDRLDAAKKDFDRITDLAAHKIVRGKFEADGTILIRTAEL